MVVPGKHAARNTPAWRVHGRQQIRTTFRIATASVCERSANSRAAAAHSALYANLPARCGPALIAPRYSRGFVLVAAIAQVIDQEHAQPRQCQKRFPRPLFDQVWRNHRQCVNGFPPLWTWIAPSEIRVTPVPHSATTMDVRACCQRLATPMMAMVCAGNGFRIAPRSDWKVDPRIGEVPDTTEECDLPEALRDASCSRRLWRVLASRSSERSGRKAKNRKRRTEEEAPTALTRWIRSRRQMRMPCSSFPVCP
jgi:hypothetical protein